MKKKIAMMLVVICLMLSVSTVSYAADENGAVHVNATAETGGIEPYYINTANISCGLEIKGNTAYGFTEVFAKKVCSIQVIMQLQHKENGSWVNKISWVESSSTGGKTMYKSYTVFEKGSYRVRAICNVGGEEVTCTSVTATY